MRRSLAVVAAVTILGGGTTRPSLRDTLLAIPQTAALGGEGTRAVTGGQAFTFPMANGPRRHQRPFSFGNRLFNTNWVEAPGSVKAFDGLGPLFNRVSCSGCHTHDGRGRPPETGQGPMDSMLVRLSVPGMDEHGGPKPHPAYGGQFSERAIRGVAPEARIRIRYEDVPGTYGDGEAYALRRPSYEIADLGYGDLGKDVMLSPRVAPQMIGLGLLEAVPDTLLEGLADPDDADGDGISGRLNHVWDMAKGAPAIGRFGWKANQPNLRQQNASAAEGDIGLTTSFTDGEEDPEMNDEFLGKLTLYTRLIAVPAQRNADDRQVRQGAGAFRDFGCAQCHLPSLTTSDAALPETAHQTIHPFTDLLLHGMGEGLADHRPDFEASGSEWRTPPLWGLGLIETVNGHDLLLHDGRARGFEEAILWHGGEGEAARERFRNAAKVARDALVAFLRSL